MGALLAAGAQAADSTADPISEGHKEFRAGNHARALEYDRLRGIVGVQWTY